MTWGVAGLAVSFGSLAALEGVTLEVPAGRVTAVVGGDGAGKSTLLRVMAGLVAPQRGTVRLPERARIGYLPTRAGGFGDLTVAENLEFVASVARLPQAGPRTDDLLERTGLAPFPRRLARDLSGGMRQKLGVIMAMLPAPALLDPRRTDDRHRPGEPLRPVAPDRPGGGGGGGGPGLLGLPGRGGAGGLGAGAPRRPPSGGRAPGRTWWPPCPGRWSRWTAPTDPARAWRRGPRWREWRPEGDPAAVTPGLEDVVIVASLAAGAGRAP